MMIRPGRWLLLLIVLLSPLALFAGQKEYPLDIQIVQVHWNSTPYGVHGFGRGNVKEGESLYGFDFTYTCPSSFTATHGDEGYPGRWKKEQTKLAILTTEIGGKHKQSECDLNTTVIVGQIYGMRNGQLVTYTHAQYQAMVDAKKQADSNAHPSDTDPAHYPLKVAILSVDWQQGAFGLSGIGKGNVHDGDSVQGINFSATCPGRFQADAGRFSAKWTQEKTRLLILMKAIGEPDKVRTCELKTDILPGVYMKNKNTGAVAMMTQDEFKSWREKQKAGTAKTDGDTSQASTATPATSNSAVIAVSASAAKTKLSVVSVPEGADIEIDGSYVGSTPSALELPVGDHTVSIRKAGYKPWDRKLKLVSGEIKVTADLEKK